MNEKTAYALFAFALVYISIDLVHAANNLRFDGCRAGTHQRRFDV